MKNIHLCTILICLMISIVSLSAQNWGTIYHSTESLTVGDIDMPNDSTIWIIGNETPILNSRFLRGSSGQFYRTANGGNTWQAGIIAEGEPFITSISAVNSQMAWASVVDTNEASAIYKTINGGTTWQMTSAPFSASSYCNFVHFWNAKEGLAMGDPLNNRYEIYLTGNGGNTWTAVSDTNILRPNSIYETGFNNTYSVVGNHIWFFTSSSRVFHSANKGVTWQVADTQLGNNPYGGSIVFNSKMQGLAVKSDYDNANANFHTTISQSLDTGKTWQKLSISNPDVYFFDIKALPNNTFLASVVNKGDFLMGQYATLMSYDLGKSWITINEDVKVNALCVSPQGNRIIGGSLNTLGQKLEVYKLLESPFLRLLTPSVLDAQISLSPNPTADQLNIQLTYKEASSFRLNINNLLGELVYFEDFKDVSTINKSLNIKHLTSGTFIVTIANSTGSLSRKFVKTE